jgi:hypothetical protein
LIVQVKEFGIYALDGFPAAVFIRPRLPSGPIALVGQSYFGTILKATFDQTRFFPFTDLGIKVGFQSGRSERRYLDSGALASLLIDPRM